MATKKDIKKTTKPAAPAGKEVAKDNKATKASANNDKLAKKKARLEALKNRPAGQRQNSKTIDVIPMENGSKVLVYAHPIRKFGVVITSITVDGEGNVIGSSTTTLPGYKVKAKKGHGNLVPGVPGSGKKGKHEENDEDADDSDGDDDEDED